jgi:hypothetical protein
MASQVKQILSVVAVLIAIAAIPLIAHPMTVKGTVAAVEPKRIQVKTGEEKKGTAPGWSIINAKTKIMRGRTVVTFDQANIKIGERVVVNADHAADGVMTALEIRLAAR